MTEPQYPELFELATPYGLHAVPEAELAEIERRVAAVPPEVAQAFADEVRAVQETMAVVSVAIAIEPPQQLRDRVLAAVSALVVRELRPKRWQRAVFAAPDVRTVSSQIPGGGTAQWCSPAKRMPACWL